MEVDDIVYNELKQQAQTIALLDMSNKNKDSIRLSTDIGKIDSEIQSYEEELNQSYEKELKTNDCERINELGEKVEKLKKQRAELIAKKGRLIERINEHGKIESTSAKLEGKEYKTERRKQQDYIANLFNVPLLSNGEKYENLSEKHVLIRPFPESNPYYNHVFCGKVENGKVIIFDTLGENKYYKNNQIENRDEAVKAIFGNDYKIVYTNDYTLKKEECSEKKLVQLSEQGCFEFALAMVNYLKQPSLEDSNKRLNEVADEIGLCKLGIGTKNQEVEMKFLNSLLSERKEKKSPPKCCRI